MLLPIFTIAFLFVAFNIYREENYIDQLNLYTFSSICIGFTLCFFLLLKNKKYLPVVELIICSLVTLIFLIRIYEYILVDLGVESNFLGTGPFWNPLVFLTYLFVFRGRLAIIFSALAYVLSVIPGIYHLLFSGNANGNV